MAEEGVVAGRGPARNERDGTAELPRLRDDRSGHLAVGALSVDASLSGNDQVGGARAVREPGGAHHELGPGAQLRVGEGDEPRAEATRRARARRVADVSPDEAFDDVG